jgi:GT2 family glycosyltransferase
VERTSHPAVAVVVVHWDQPERLRHTLAALAEQSVGVEAIVVDNGSSPDATRTLEQVVDQSPIPVELIALGANRGFGPGANAGLERFLARGRGTWVGVCPHDALPATDTLRRLVTELERRPRAAMACADVGDGCVPVMDPYFGGMTVPGGGDDGWEDVDYPHGTLLVARRRALEELGLFDERYFAYCEEAELGVRARRAGWRIGLVRGARVTNPTMRSGSPVVDYLMLRNTLLLVREASGRYHAVVRTLIACWQLLRGLVDGGTGLVFAPAARVEAIIDFTRKRFGPPPARLLATASGPEHVDEATRAAAVSR